MFDIAIYIHETKVVEEEISRRIVQKTRLCQHMKARIL